MPPDESCWVASGLLPVLGKPVLANPRAPEVAVIKKIEIKTTGALYPSQAGPDRRFWGYY
jgi:hypothetical protein